MAEDKDVISSSGGNPSLDPAAILSLLPKAGTRGDAKLESSFERNSEGRLVHWSQLVDNNKELEKLRKSTYQTGDLSTLRTNPPAKTERIPPQRDLSGGGAKSELKPKNFGSAGGRMGVAGISSKLAAAAIGNMKAFIPTMGIQASSITTGPFRFKGLSHVGAFPVLNMKQFDAGLAATYTNIEEEDE